MADANLITSKKCNKCHTVKAVDQFYRDRRNRDGYGYSCKECLFEKYPLQRPKQKREDGLHVLERPDVTFKDVQGFPGYRVGDDGSVWSVWHRGFDPATGKWNGMSMGDLWWPRKQRLSVCGRSVFVQLWRRDGTTRASSTGHLVLEVFVGPCPPGMECRHLDGNVWNNNVNNLKWGTHTENMQDCIRHGTMPRGERHGSAKLNADKIAEAKALRSQGLSWAKIGRAFGVTSTAIRLAVIGVTWKHLT